MAIYKTKSRLAYSNIREFILMAGESLGKIQSQPKDGLAVYGAPAMGLLLASVDAMGSFYDDQLKFRLLPGNDKINGLQKDEVKDHFKRISKKFPQLFDERDVDRYFRLRNDILHNAVVGSDYELILGDITNPILIDKNGSAATNPKIQVNLQALLCAVKQVREQFEEDFEHEDAGYRNHIPSTVTGSTQQDKVIQRNNERTYSDKNLEKLHETVLSLAELVHKNPVRDGKKQKEINGKISSLQQLSNTIIATYNKK